MSLSRKLRQGHLRLIVKIAETGQLAMAADALSVTQPAASRSLAEIEALAGGPLFLRQPRGMAPTELGAAFLRRARSLLQDFDALEADMAGLTGGSRGTVSVGAVAGPAVGSLVPALRALRQEAPEARIGIEVAPSAELVRGLGEGRFDFVLGRLPAGQDSTELLLHPARHETVALLVHESHALAGQGPVPLLSMAESDWVMQVAGSPIRAALEAAFLAEGLPVPTNVIDSSSLLVSLALLESGTTISPQTREAAALLTGHRIGARFAVLQTERPVEITPFFLIRPRHRPLSPLADRLMQGVLSRL